MYADIYLSCVVDGNLVFVGGHDPIDGDRVIRGKVGRDGIWHRSRVKKRPA
jgi:hypothetical protein